MKKSHYVRIEKLETSANPMFAAAAMSEWTPGEENFGKGLPIGYTVEGFLVRDIVAGEPAVMDRRKRNDVEMMGDFQTSTVVAVYDGGFTTQNSVYRVCEAEEDKSEWDDDEEVET